MAPLAVAGVLVLVLNPAGLAAGQASFDCDRARTWAEHAICASAELAGLDRAVAARYDGLQAAIRSKHLRAAIENDQHAWLATRAACETDPLPADCLRRRYQERRVQLDLHRLAFVGPRLAEPPRLDCHLAAASQVELGRCERLLESYVGRTLELAIEPAAAEMAELDRTTTAEIGAEASFRTAQSDYERYRDAECRAVAASFAGGSGAGLAQLGCLNRMSWRRAGEIADRHLFQPAPWSRTLDASSGSIRLCLDRIGPGGDSRITAVRELDDGSLAMRITTNGRRRECAVSTAREVSALSDVAEGDLWPGEGDAWLRPAGLGATGATPPPADPCEEVDWFQPRDGDLAGWIVHRLCW